MDFNYQGIFGFDVSHWQDNNSTAKQIDFNKMKSFGAKFVIIKAGEFYTLDEDFIYNWMEAKKAGLPRSAYWFGNYNANPKVEALAFWNAIKNDPAEGMYFIDYEYRGWSDWRKLADFLVEFQRLSGLPNEKIGIYTGYYYWMEHRPDTLASQLWFSKFQLWLPWYADVSIVKVPFPWTKCLLWQCGTPPEGSDAGVESIEIDKNKLNGGVEELNKYLGGTLPPTGDIMEITLTADLIYGQSSRVRETPSLTGAIKQIMVGPLSIQGIGEKIQADGYTWIQIFYPYTGYVALTTSYTNVIYTPPTTPGKHKVSVYIDDVLEWSKEF